jgi:phosphopentomutase
VDTVGKVGQLFAGAGIDHDHAAHDNATAIEETSALLADLDAGLVFTNLVETDTVFGIDAAVADWLEGLGEGDLLVVTADHGCDIAHPSSDHTREHAPLLAAFAGSNGHRHDGPLADVGASALRWLVGVDDPDLPGSSFV